MFKLNWQCRTFHSSDISMLVSGTLIIFITSLFMNAGAELKISEEAVQENQVVMNSVIAAASSGFLVAMMN